MKRPLSYKMKTLDPAWAYRAGQVQSSLKNLCRGGLLLAVLLSFSIPSFAWVQKPTELNLSVNQIHESNAIGVVIGILSADPPAGVCTFTLVPGTGDDDNQAFQTAGNTLKAATVFDFETKEIYSIRLRVTNEDGDFIEKSFLVQVIDVYEITTSIEATNIVTPNGDGKNDTWIIRNLVPHSNNEVKIFDRSGRMIYIKKNYNNEWDGRTTNGDMLAEGVYLYVVDFGAGLNPFKGTISLIRDRR